MQACPSCSRHLLRLEPACPFCGAPTGQSLVAESQLSRLSTRFGGAMLAAVTPLVLAACYGTSFVKDTDSAIPDADGDGVDALLDCDDENAAVYPNAAEVCDDTLDNDCDGLIDAEDSDCATQ